MTADFSGGCTAFRNHLRWRLFSGRCGFVYLLRRISTLDERANPLDTLSILPRDAVACHRELLNQQRDEP
jgi:hypothetical protein